MNTFSTMQTGDHHLDPKNLAYTLPALDAVIGMVKEHRPDLFLFTGDAWIHRGRVDGDSGWKWRTRMESGADAARCGLDVTVGNHDLVFRRDKVDNLTAQMTGADGVMSDGHKVRVHSKIMTEYYDASAIAGDLSARVAVVHVPTPNKYWAEAYIREHDIGTGDQNVDIAQLLTSAIRGEIIKARTEVGDTGAVLVSYHGTVLNSKLGNEMQMTAGVDVAVSRDAFAGADLVMAGHIHNPQKIEATEHAPAIWYNGALTPLTYNDVGMDPVIYKHTVLFNPGAAVTIETQTLPVPVTSQMWDIPMDATDFSEDIDIRTALVSALRGVVASVQANGGTVYGDRVRFVVTASTGIVRQITDTMLETIRVDDEFRLESVTKIVERVVDHETVMDTDRTMNVLDGLDAWLAINHAEMPVKDLEFIQALAREIETSVTDENMDSHYSFLPCLLRVKNWAQYAEAELDFSKLDSLVAVAGENTTGKSNLMRAIPFALFKKLLFGDVIGDVVTYGERSGEVELYFKSTAAGFNGMYRITRTVRKAATGRGATAKLLFQKSTAAEGEDVLTGGWELAVEGSAGETEREIQRLVGPPDLFLATCFATQNSVDAVLKLGPSEFRDMLSAVLHRNFQARAESSAVRRRVSEKTNARLANERSVYSGMAAGLDAAKASATETTDLLTAANANALVADGDLVLAREQLGQATAEHARLSAKMDGRDAVTAEHHTLTEGVDKAKARVDAAAAAVRQLEAIRRDIDVCGAVDVDAARRTVTRAEVLREDGAKELADYRMASLGERDRLGGASQTAEGESTTAKHRAETLDAEVERLTRTVNTMNDVPCGGAVWDDPERNNVEATDMSVCQFLRDARTARDRLPAAKIERDAAHATRRTNAEAHTAARKAFDEYDGIFTKREGELDRAWQALDVDLRAVRKTLETAEATERKLAGLRASEAEMAPVATSHADRTQELAELADKLKASQDTIDGFETDSMNVGMAGETLASARKRVQELETTVANTQQRVSELNADSGRRLAAVTSAEDAVAESKRLGGEIATGESMVALFTVYESAVGRDGIPQLMVENMVLPAMQSMTNDYLADTVFRVTVEPDRANITGESKAGVFVTFTDHRGEFPLSSASGFQRMALGSAIRNALAGLHALATGTKLWFAFQDEGFGAYSDANLAGAKTTIRRIANDRQWFIYVSHVDGMSDVADTVVNVADVDGSSVLTIN